MGNSQAAEEMLERLYAEFRQEVSRLDAEREKSFVWFIAIAHQQGIEHLSLNRQFEVIETTDWKSHLPDALCHSRSENRTI